MAGYPKIYNIEMDPHEDLIVAAMFGWVSGPRSKLSMSTWQRSRDIQIRPAEHHAISQRWLTDIRVAMP